MNSNNSILQLLLIWIFAARNRAHLETNSCGGGWISFKDEKCFQAVAKMPEDQHFMGYDQASVFCKELDKDATLPCVRTGEEQDFLQDFLASQNLAESSVWLGARKIEGNFIWEDKAEFKYAFWSENNTSDNECISMGGESLNENGRWRSEDCSQKNFVICQKRQSWSTVKLQNFLIDLNDELLVTKRELQSTKSELDKTISEFSRAKADLEALKAKSFDNSSSSSIQNLLEGQIDSIRQELVSIKADATHTRSQIETKIQQLAINVTNFTALQANTSNSITSLQTLIGSVNKSIHTNGEISTGNFSAITSLMSSLQEELESAKEATSAGIGNVSGKISALSVIANNLQSQLIANTSSILTDIQRLKFMSEKNKTPPVGFIYIQYPGQTGPSSLWPSVSWSDVSGMYAGLFFRVVGGNSAGFGVDQDENAPRLQTIQFEESRDHSHSGPAARNLSPGNCQCVTSGGRMGSWNGINFCLSGGEVRPKNRAIKVWKRLS